MCLSVCVWRNYLRNIFEIGHIMAPSKPKFNSVWAGWPETPNFKHQTKQNHQDRLRSVPLVAGKKGIKFLFWNLSWQNLVRHIHKNLKRGKREKHWLHYSWSGAKFWGSWSDESDWVSHGVTATVNCDGKPVIDPAWDPCGWDSVFWI